MGFALAAGLLALPAFAARPVEGTLSAGAPGQIVDLASGRGEAELFVFDGALAPALLATRPDESLRVEGWPVAPGVRRAVRLSRRDIYAPGAKIYRVDGKILTEVPRSPFAFFIGEDEEGAGNRFMASVDPSTGSLTALIHGPEGVHEISRDASGRGSRHLLARPAAPPGGTITCGQEGSIETAIDYGPARDEHALATRAPAVLSSLHSAVVAIDTDQQYMTYWGNSTTNVTNYIGQLLTSINVMYERDLNLRLLLGTTFLRTSGTDPYVANDGGNAGVGELNEFTSYWNAHYPKATYPRSVAALLSGKQTSTNSASGIAWVAGSVCGSSTDYSVNQLFKVNYLAGDTLIAGHEIGHNLGSPHTHCYADPKPDTCYSGEQGLSTCFVGATSCPAPTSINGMTNVTGTLMSYCHLSGISGCTTSLVFHPLTISRYVGAVLDTGATQGCLAVVGPPPVPPPPVSAATTFHGVTPCRVLDTRNPAGPLGGPAIGAASARTFVVSNACGVPAGAVAISSNVTAVNPAAQGDLIAYPGGISQPVVSTLSFRPGKTRGNNAHIYLAPGGSIVVRNNSASALDLVIDVNGYYAP